MSIWSYNSGKHLAYIDYTKCKLCRKCESECPTGAIKAVNFPPKRESQTSVVEQPTTVNNENKEN